MSWRVRSFALLAAASAVLATAGRSAADDVIVRYRAPERVTYYEPAPTREVVRYYEPAPVREVRYYEPAPARVREVTYYEPAPVREVVTYAAPARPVVTQSTRYGLFGRPRETTTRTYYP